MDMLNIKTIAGKMTNRQKHVDEVNRLVLNGEIKKANRKANEYNSKVDETMKPYYDEHNDWADDIADEVNPNLYINVDIKK